MLRFSIREILLATAVAALILGWWIDRRQLANNLKETTSHRSFYALSALRWRRIALEFAQDMRDDGWYVVVKNDGSGWESASWRTLGREKAAEKNSAEPLPASDAPIVPPDYQALSRLRGRSRSRQRHDHRHQQQVADGLAYKRLTSG